MEDKWEILHVPARAMVRDLTVNPRNPSDTWARKQIADYNPAILGLFVLSERLIPDEEAPDGTRRDLVILDGSNRHNLMALVGDLDRDVVCQVFHGLTHQEEARIAREYNDRQVWKGLRIFLAECEAGEPVASEIRRVLEEHGWFFDSSYRGAKDGLVQGVAAFYRLINVAVERNARQVKAAKGTERYAAAVESGRRDAMRVLEQAVQVYTAAFPTRPSPYAPQVMYSIALVLLVYGERVSLERMATQLRDHSSGQRIFIADSRAMMGPMRMKAPDAMAQLALRLYNKGLTGTSKARLPERWEPIAK